MKCRLYHVLNAANTAGKSSVFVEYIFNIIHGFLTELTANKAMHIGGSIEDKVLASLRKSDKHSARSLSGELGISERQIQRILKRLKDNYKIEHIGVNCNGNWMVH